MTSIRSLSLCLGVWLLLTGCEKVPRTPAIEPSGKPSATQSTPPKKVSTSEIEVPLVKGGKAVSVIVLDSLADKHVHDAVRRFVATVERSTGAAIPVVPMEKESEIEDGISRIYIGDSPRAAQEGLQSVDLAPETYRMATRGTDVFIIGAREEETLKASGISSRPLLWALNSILEDQIGVRWLWPGELGTYVPKRNDLTIPAGDVSRQPRLELRDLRLLLSSKRPLALPSASADEQIKKEALEWGENHQYGTRSKISFGHSFGDWWEKYGSQHPDYFAELPAPHTQPYPKAGRVKLRLSNPAVIKQIAREYEEAGAPKYWNVCPNDGKGFDVSEATRAWDDPKNQDPQDIFSSKGNLTARYVHFWNLLHERLKQINPDVVLATYAYACYRNAPPKGHKLTARAVLQIVDGLESYDNWNAWSEQAEGLFLRPNWWHQGADAPYLSLEQTFKFLDFAFKHRMMGLDMDSILSYWATQGPNYYMVARKMNNPDITLEEILEEYTSAFGKGAPKIRAYLDYWQEMTSKFNYPLNTGDAGRRPNSEYQKLVDTGKIPGPSILNGSKYALPHLYTDEVLAPALRLLDEAETLIGNSDEEALKRVGFLRLGLESMKATRDHVALGQKLKRNPSKELLQKFTEATRELETLRRKLSPNHVIWAESAKNYEERYSILLRPSAFKRNEIDLDGL